MNKFKNIVACGSSLLFLSSSLSPVLADTVTASSSSSSSTDTAASASSSSAANILSSSEVVLKSSTTTASSKTTDTNSQSTPKAASTTASKNDTSTVTAQSAPVAHSEIKSQTTGTEAAVGLNQSGTIQDNVNATDTNSANSMSSESSSVKDDSSLTQSSSSTSAVSSTISISGGKQLVNVDKMKFDNANDKLVANKDNVLNINFAPNEKSNLKMTFKYNLQPTDNASQVLLRSKGVHITVNLVIPQKDGTKKIIKNVSPLITDENGEFTINFKDLDGTQINDQAYLQILLPDNVQINGKHNLTYKLNVTNPVDKNKDQNQNKQSQPKQKDDSQSVKDNEKHSDKKAVKVTSPTDFQKNVKHLQNVEKYNAEPATNQSSQMPAQLDSQGNPVTNTQKTAMLAKTNATDTHAKILTGIGIVTAMIATGIFAVQSKDKRKFS